jgi:hypothetical protein
MSQLFCNLFFDSEQEESQIGTCEREYQDLTYWLAEVTQVLYSIKQSPQDEYAQKVCVKSPRFVQVFQPF